MTMADGTMKTDGRDMPTLEEFARFLWQRGGSQADAQKVRLMDMYASVWGPYEGNAPAALRQARELCDEMTMTSEERFAESQR